MVDSMDEERIMERVRRLLALANDPAASDNEQRIALEQAQRLMNRHAIEQWQLEENHDEVTIHEKRIRFERNPCAPFLRDLSAIVARGNRCRAAYWISKADNGRNLVGGIILYGIEADIKRAETIWTAMETSRAVMWKARAKATRNAKPNAAWRDGYYRGFQDEIAWRYRELEMEMESNETGKALVLDREGRVEEYMRGIDFENHSPKLGKRKRPSRAAYRYGRKDGARQRLGQTELDQDRE